MVALPAAFVEPLIALSIAYVAVENVLTRRLRLARGLVFGFGLLHGMGFAGVLPEIGLPRERLPDRADRSTSASSSGQLAVITAGVRADGLRLRASRGTGGVVVPGSLLIAAIGLYWTGERVFDYWLSA